jgi:hypothetical protein
MYENENQQKHQPIWHRRNNGGESSGVNGKWRAMAACEEISRKAKKMKMAK